MGRLAAAVLVGGRSRRMGTNKALLRLQDDGPTIIERVIETLSHLTDDVMLVGGGETSMTGARGVPDLVPGAGVLGGIHAALRASSASHVLIVGCDMPFLSVDLLRFMWHQAEGHDVVIATPDRPQPLHAIYAQSCLPIVESQLQHGDFRASGWLSGVRVRSISGIELQQYDPVMLSTFNMNTPEDLAFARGHVAGESALSRSGDAGSA